MLHKVFCWVQLKMASPFLILGQQILKEILNMRIPLFVLEELQNLASKFVQEILLFFILVVSKVVWTDVMDRMDRVGRQVKKDMQVSN
jgi:hypothetical protein